MNPINKGEGYQTARGRKTLSVPMRRLSKAYSLKGKDCLDFGCGRGVDADLLGIDKYDPNWGPTDLPEKKYDYIFCTYVLNVILDSERRSQVLGKIKSLLKPTGRAFITVRADVPGGSKTQVDVFLEEGKLLYKNSSFRTYEINA